MLIFQFSGEAERGLIIFWSDIFRKGRAGIWTRTALWVQGPNKFLLFGYQLNLLLQSFCTILCLKVIDNLDILKDTVLIIILKFILLCVIYMIINSS